MGTAAAGVLGAGMGLYNTIQSSKDKRDAANALENYKRQELENVAEGMQVSTLGSDIKKEEQARLSATEIDALRGAGARGIIGGAGRVEAGNQAVNREIAADLDLQQKEIDRLRAEDQARIRNIQEEREKADIAGLSSQYNAAKQDMNMGIGQMVQGAGMFGNNISGNIAPKERVSEEVLGSNLRPSGVKLGTAEIPTSIFSTNPLNPTSSRPRMGGLGASQYDIYGNKIY